VADRNDKEERGFSGLSDLTSDLIAADEAVKSEPKAEAEAMTCRRITCPHCDKGLTLRFAPGEEQEEQVFPCPLCGETVTISPQKRTSEITEKKAEDDLNSYGSAVGELDKAPSAEPCSKYSVSFGTAFLVDQFGFIRKGTVTAERDNIVLEGKKSWPVIAKVGVFLAITVLPMVLFKIGLGFLLALFIVHYLCCSQGSLSIQKSTIRKVQRNGRLIKFWGQYPGSHATKKSVFKVDTKWNAASLERELKR